MQAAPPVRRRLDDFLTYQNLISGLSLPVTNTLSVRNRYRAGNIFPP
jgi:hypothetical protein